MFENHPKCRIWYFFFSFWYFPPIFVSYEITVNVARFARNFEWDFLGIFKHRGFFCWSANNTTSSFLIPHSVILLLEEKVTSKLSWLWWNWLWIWEDTSTRFRVAHRELKWFLHENFRCKSKYYKTSGTPWWPFCYW